MTELLDRAATWLTSQLRQHNSRPVTYRRGLATVALRATIGQTEFGQSDMEGMQVTHRIRDFLFPAEELVLDGEITLPALGDRIDETADGKTYTYELLPLPSGELYRYADPYRRQLRVHTKETAVS